VRKPRLAVAAVAVAATLGISVPAARAAATQAPAMQARVEVRQAVTHEPLHVVVPAYWYQDIPSWTELATDDPVSSYDGSLTVSNAILNPCAPSGKTCSPGSAVNPATVKSVQQEEAAGITLYGYVATDYDKGGVSIAKAEKEMREYHNWYGLNDMFLDEAATSCSDEASYYLKLYNYVHKTFGGLVILNPGTTTSSCYMSASDMIDMYESGPSGLSTWTPPSWMASYSPARFIAIVYNVSGTTALASTLATIGADGFGNTYITDQTLPNPYAQLPSYWSSEAADVSGTSELAVIKPSHL
jgi:hypothetical protein